MAFVAFVLLVAGAWAGSYWWSHKYGWKIGEKYEIDVYAATPGVGSAPPTKGALLGSDLLSDFADGEYYYWIDNVGNIAAKLTITESWSGDSGLASASWAYYSGSWTAVPTNLQIPKGGWIAMRLTLSGFSTIPLGEGYYQFTFTPSKVP